MSTVEEAVLEADSPNEPPLDVLREGYRRRAPNETAQYRLFMEVFSPGKEEILYAGSGGDSVPTQVFQGRRVINVDRRDDHLTLLRETAPKAEIVCADACSYVPSTQDGMVDMIIFRGFASREALNHLRPGGYVLASGDTRILDEVAEHSDVHLVGVMVEEEAPEEQNGEPASYKLLTGGEGNLGSYIHPVRTDDELVRILEDEDPQLLQRLRFRMVTDGNLRPNLLELAREELGYIPRMKGHSKGRPSMFVFRKNAQASTS